MKLPKKETFLYWFVHCVVWIGIALPTLFFLLRINHPQHEAKPNLSQLSNSTSNNETLTSGMVQSCKNYSRLQNCLSVPKKNFSKNISTSTDDEIRSILNAVRITKHSSTCKRRLEVTFCFKKYISCMSLGKNESFREDADVRSQLVDETNKFCDTCSKSFHIKRNASFQIEDYKWLMDLSCISELLGRNGERSTSEKNASSCLYPLVKDKSGTCRIPCDWSLMSPRLRGVYYAVMVVNFWLALITTVLTLATLASFPKMREFPHIVRFYILICSVLYATASLLPLRIGLAKVYCGDELYWKEEGHSTIPTIIEGAISHYFFLAFCFWSLCYVINAYSVIVKQVRKIFDKKYKYHFIQFSICTTLPALFVAMNMAVKKPGYRSLFLDRMTSVFMSPVLEYVTFTLPVQISIGVSVSLLWSVIRFVRKVRQSNTTFQSVRPDEDIRGFINAERQFIKLAVLFVATVAVILSSEVVITYRNEEYLHRVDEYFECLETSDKHCPRPEVQIYFLSSVKICGPGIYCLLNFFLLFFNKDTRSVWRKWFRSGYKIMFCKWMESDGKDSSGLPANDGSRPRSCTLDTNASLNSLHKLSLHSTATRTGTLQKTMQLDTLQVNQVQNTAMAGSVSPKEYSPLTANGDTS